MATPPATTFQDLVVWQKSHALVLWVYKITARFPRAEQYGLISQMRQAAVSIPANIAEGFKRAGRADKARMLNVAQGSLEELRYYLRLGADLGYDIPAAVAADLDEVSRLLDAYRRKIVASLP
jgi:four helix bundle protein